MFGFCKSDVFSGPLCKAGNARFTRVPFKALYDQVV